MRNEAYEDRIKKVKERAHGNWTPILQNLGLDKMMLVKRVNMPCPKCGGVDRFQYTDKFGDGTYHCRGCGPGDGFELLQAVNGWSFHKALEEVETQLGCGLPAASPSADAPSREKMKHLARRIWNEARPIVAGDSVDRYLRSRGIGLPSYPSVLRCHPALGYFERAENGKSRKVGEFPAMLARVDGPEEPGISLHRTYLQDGRKAPVPEVKKLLSSGIQGAAIRLFEPGKELAIAEGIEKSLAIHLATLKPVWPAINATNLEKIWIPPDIERISIYGDNNADGGFEGQASAYILARRLRKEARIGTKRQVRVFIPRGSGLDWHEVWQAKLARQQSQATA